jgi:hypothetical protein
LKFFNSEFGRIFGWISSQKPGFPLQSFLRLCRKKGFPLQSRMHGRAAILQSKIATSPLRSRGRASALKNLFASNYGNPCKKLRNSITEDTAGTERRERICVVSSVVFSLSDPASKQKQKLYQQGFISVNILMRSPRSRSFFACAF